MLNGLSLVWSIDGLSTAASSLLFLMRLPAFDPRYVVSEGAAEIKGGFVQGKLIDRCPELELVQDLFHRDLATKYLEVDAWHDASSLSWLFPHRQRRGTGTRMTSLVGRGPLESLWAAGCPRDVKSGRLPLRLLPGSGNRAMNVFASCCRIGCNR